MQENSPRDISPQQTPTSDPSRSSIQCQKEHAHHSLSQYRERVLAPLGLLAQALKYLAILVIRSYQTLVSPLLPPACRFMPTCSQYTLEAITRYGLLKGSYLGLRRLLRCHPFHPGGYDPVK